MLERIKAKRVAEITGLSVRQIQNMGARGLLPTAAKMGAAWTFNERAIRQWVADQEDETRRKAAAIDSWTRGICNSPLVPESVERAYEKLLG